MATERTPFLDYPKIKIEHSYVVNGVTYHSREEANDALRAEQFERLSIPTELSRWLLARRLDVEAVLGKTSWREDITEVEGCGPAWAAWLQSHPRDVLRAYACGHRHRLEDAAWL